MKRKFAVAMSAVLAATSTMPVFAEEETAFAPATYVGEFVVTADGESMIFSVKAEQFAEDSGSHIGKIKTASQGSFSISDRDSNTPQIKRVRVVTSITYTLVK